MPNEQTSVPLFTSGEVLTAANMNLSAGTGVPVFTNTTTRDAAFGGTGEKVLAEGQLCYLSSTNVVQYYDGAAWATVGPSTAGGLVFISATAIAGASVSVNNCFTSTYDNYRFIFAPSAVSGDATMSFRLRLSGTDSSTSYKSQRIFGTATSISTLGNPSGTSEMIFGYLKTAAPTNTGFSVDIFAPAQARATIANSVTGGLEGADQYSLLFYNTHTPATAYDGFTVLTTGSTTTGTIYLYGYAKA